MRSAGLAIGLMTAISVAPSAAQLAVPDPAARRVVAVGDIHADLAHLRSVLHTTGMIDGSDHWVGGAAILVQVGDFLDRGVEVRAVLELLIRLQEEAAASGGQVIVLLGNHEAMNLLGLHRDVNPAAYAAFVDAESESRRREAWKQTRAFHSRRRLELGQQAQRESPDSEAAWMAEYPPGRLEYLEALGPDGVYGRWLRTLPAVARVGRSLFMHGGVGPQHLDLDEEAINRRVADEIAAYDRLRASMIAEGLALPTASVQGLVFQALNEIRLAEARAQRRGRVTASERAKVMRLQPVLNCSEWFLLSPEGPLWYRGMANWSEDEHGQLVDTLLTTMNADRFVLGHTEHYDGTIHVRFEGQIAFVDSGLPAALEIGGDQRLEAVYPDGRVVLAGPGSTHDPQAGTRRAVGPGPS